ncbi:arginine N-succinyltransferase [Marinobacter salicampi]|uniref:arginine N-succinyltransferase n=1 Tax=Marinobacter salicampi TaxID=435907 RepID=UPI00140804E9|nr:arginine N-succinyltransferase [Marinobacter salicampi]
MWVVRPAQPDDAAAIQKLAAAQGARVSTLPRADEKLSEKIAWSCRSFAGDSEQQGRERFLFVLEDTSSGRICGTAGIDAHAGNGQPFYNYRQDALIHASHELGISRPVEVLYPSHALTGCTLLCSFMIESALRDTDAFELLSRARLLFIARHRALFSDDMAVEIQGVQTESGAVPFWDSLGRHFFNMDFDAADEYSSRLSKTFIAELMPPNPIYVTLLTEPAQEAIGVAHPLAQKTQALLEREGFRTGDYIDIFDGGPALQARTDTLKTVVTSLPMVLRPGEEEAEAGALCLLSVNDHDRFRCVLTPLTESLDGSAIIPVAFETLLGTQPGEEVQVAPL